MSKQEKKNSCLALNLKQQMHVEHYHGVLIRFKNLTDYCWDEPALKATFDLTLVVPPNLTPISNMPINKTQDNRVTFATTPKMSTYLLAWVLGDLDYIEDKTEEGIIVRVYGPRGMQEQGRFALSVATRVITYFGKYFKIPYQLPKMDLIAIPDFSAGAVSFS
jgi:puromycin-sensitive aminopeptidase